ncbi:MAG: DUF397 domain-containing protein [Pseudonocardiaceae bacterium]
MMTAPEQDGIVWRTSSYSYESGDCVEVAPGPDAVLVRDSKNRPGPALTVPPTAWQTFLTTLPH